MRRRFLPCLAALCLCLMTYESGRATDAIPVWVVLSESDGVYAETAAAVRAEVEARLPGRIEWRVVRGNDWPALPAPQWVVAVGVAALERVQQKFSASPEPAPAVLATLLPRQSFERLAAGATARVRAGRLSAVVLDQPPARQMALIRLALPAVRRVGVLSGLAMPLPALEQAAHEAGLQLVAVPAAGDALFPALRILLPAAEVLLALPDPEVFNSRSVPPILAAALRQRVPLLGFSPAYVKAGALMALYSTPAQIGRQTGTVLMAALADNRLPPPQSPREFVVGVNPDVAHSFGVHLDAARLAGMLHRQEEWSR